MGGWRTAFYGWRIVAAGAAVNGLAWSVRSGFAVIYAAMLADLGWSRTEAVFGYSLSWLVMAAFYPVTGWLYDRLGPRLVVPLGGAALALGLLLTSLAHAPAHYYLSFSVLIGFGSAATAGPTNALISRWFIRRRGTALGIVTAGTSLAVVLSLPLLAALVEAVGWRGALRWQALVLALALLPLPALVYRASPAALGLTPDGAAGPPRSPVRITSERRWRVAEALRTRQFWAAFVMLMTGTIAFQLLMTHQVAYAEDRAIATATAATIFGLTGVFQVAGNLGGGLLSDRWGRQWVYSLGGAAWLAGIGLLMLASGPERLALLCAYAAALGLGAGARIALSNAIPADAFGGPSFGLILGLLQAGSAIGGFIGPTVGGVVFDRSGSYLAAFALAGVAVVLGGLAAWLARPDARFATATRPLAAPSTAGGADASSVAGDD